jgi:hypothetical protein
MSADRDPEDWGAIPPATLLAAGLKPMRVRINLNETVRVQLTEHGRSIMAGAKLPVRTDEHGYTTLQFYDLMNIFGQHLFLGCAKIPFTHNAIEFEVHKSQIQD